jgi:pimeloyl-ACP methyl ester carboxylesterase
MVTEPANREAANVRLPPIADNGPSVSLAVRIGNRTQVHLPRLPQNWRAFCSEVRRLPMKRFIVFAFVVAGSSVGAFSQPLAIARDPPLNPAHPASGAGLQFVSHGERVNAMLYLPAGAGPHPAVILLHGLPGNEQNLDLARAMQRAGWAVITFHYRGSWGSGGNFTLEGGCDDVDALLHDIASASGTGKWHVDPRRIVVMGHSYGGFVAACAAQRHPELVAAGLLAPWDIGNDAREFSKLSPSEARKRASSIFNDVDGRLVGAGAQSLMNAIRSKGARLSLAATAPALARRPLLLATATRDGPDDQAGDLRNAVAGIPNAQVTYRLFDTDHGFNDQRIALETYVLEWLATLSAAPGP